MKLNRVKIKDLITICNEKNNNDNNFPFYGININKEFMPSVANTEKVDRKKYKIMRKNRFVFSGMQTGRDECIRIGMFEEENPVLVSPAYTTFEVTNKIILPTYLFMIFKSKEMDRYGSFLSDSSVRANLDWDRFCDIELKIPSIEIQKKYVDIYEGLLANLHAYEKGLDDLKLTCNGYIEELRKKIDSVRLYDYIEDTCKKNDNTKLKIVGISKEQKLISSESRTNGVDKNKYYLLKKDEFAYSPIHINEGSIAFNDQNEEYIVSPIYRTFKVKDESKLLSKYLMLRFSRNEFIRYCWFYAFGSARDSLEWNQLCDVKIPIPDINIQKSIVEIFDVLNFRKNNLDKIKRNISNICPILIQGSIQESLRQ